MSTFVASGDGNLTRRMLGGGRAGAGWGRSVNKNMVGWKNVYVLLLNSRTKVTHSFPQIPTPMTVQVSKTFSLALICGTNGSNW